MAAESLQWRRLYAAAALGGAAVGLLIVLGLFPASIPLSSILPQGVAGCSLLARPDLLDLHIPTAGGLQTQIAIPNTVALAGRLLHQQVVPVELGLLGNITAITSTNTLTLTIGSF